MASLNRLRNTLQVLLSDFAIWISLPGGIFIDLLLLQPVVRLLLHGDSGLQQRLLQLLACIVVVQIL